jgi:uncharacterized protein YbjT (DUF2867 family)
MTGRSVFVTGGTGYIGSRFIRSLLARGHEVRGLVRPGSEKRLPAGCEPVIGDALNGSTYAGSVGAAEVFVHLVGVSHPNPSKARQFRTIDLVAAREAIAVALPAGTRHFVYLSVAHPAPVMKGFIDVRMQCERLLQESGMNATVVRPWYVLGPGHWWPCLLLPVYIIAEWIPPTRESAQRLGLVSLGQMVRALVWAVENPAEGMRVLGVQDIKSAGSPL